MRKDILPLCDQHYRTMEFVLAPYSADRSIEFFRCTDKFCHRCFGERIGYTTPKREDAPVLTPNQPVCAVGSQYELHGAVVLVAKGQNVLSHQLSHLFIERLRH